MNKIIILIVSTIFFSIGYMVGLGVEVKKSFFEPIEVYCPMTAEGEPISECYSEFVVDGNCAYINSRIICGGGYVLTVK